MTIGTSEVRIRGSRLLWLQKEAALTDVEILARIERRRKWTAEEKAALLAEVEAEGGRVSAVARRHGISDSLLYNWRSAWRAAVAMRVSDRAEFVPVGIVGPAIDGAPTLLPGPEQSSSTGG